MKAPHVVVVSLRKSGTHLVREVFSAIGYAPRGEVFSAPEEQPLLPAEQMWRVLQMIYLPAELDELTSCSDLDLVDRRMKQAIAALNESWRIRLGIPRRGLAVYDETIEGLAARALSRAKRFADTPQNSCWFVHQLPLDRVDEYFIREWTDTGEPRIILNYRDPRDVLLSMVNFLSGLTPGGVGEFAEHHVHSAILRSVDTLGERLDLALTDPAFPGMDSFASALWLLRHPNVCKVSFEELVGPPGGGSEMTQQAAVRRIIDFVGADADLEKIVENVFNRDSFTFFRGQIGGWREHFTASHEALFNRRYGEILELYSYATEHGGLLSR